MHQKNISIQAPRINSEKRSRNAARTTSRSMSCRQRRTSERRACPGDELMIVARACLFIPESPPYIPLNLNIHPPLTLTNPSPLTNFTNAILFDTHPHSAIYTRRAAEAIFITRLELNTRNSSRLRFLNLGHIPGRPVLSSHTITHTHIHNDRQGFVSRPRAGEAPTFIR